MQLQAMDIGRCRGMPVLFAAVAVVAAAAGAGARPCFDACFDPCVPYDEFWFCQLSCYHRCGGRGGFGCERSCVLSLCGQLRPGSKMMAACRDTCRKSYAAVACREGESGAGSRFHLSHYTKEIRKEREHEFYGTGCNRIIN